MAYKLENYNTEAQYQSTITTGKNLSVSGTTSPVGGISTSQPVSAEAVPIGGAQWASSGSSVGLVSGSVYFISCWVPANMTVTNINVLQGNLSSSTNKWIGILFDSTGAPVANSALAGVQVGQASGTNTFIALPLTATYSAVGPKRFYIGLQSNGTADDNFKAVGTNSFVGVLTGVTSGTFGTVPTSITVPTTFTVNQGPISYLN